MTAAPPYAGALLRYRIMAFVTGTVLLLGVFLTVPLQLFAHEQGPAEVIWTAHGFLFIVYVLATVDLGLRLRWLPDHAIRMLLTMAAGTIPFLSFVAERNVRHFVRDQHAQQVGGAS